MTIKITGLTRSNVQALDAVFNCDPEGVGPWRTFAIPGFVTTSATTATFHVGSAGNAVRVVNEAIQRIPGRGHPRASLHAVLRKLVRAFEAEHASLGQ